MHILHIFYSVLAFLATPFIKVCRASALTWVVLVINADKNLQDVNMEQAAYTHYLEERVRQGQQQQIKILNYAWSCAIFLLERVAVIEPRARDTQIDLAEKEEELEAVRQAYSHAQARIASLENTLSKNASEHKDQIRALAMSNLAILNINRAQGEELKHLKAQVDDFKDTTIARREEQDVEAQRIRMKTAKIQAMTKQRKASRRIQETRQHAHRQIITAHVDRIADLEKMVTAKDKAVKRLRSKVASLERIATGAIAERNQRENEVLSLQAEVGQMKEQVAEGAVTMVVRQLATTEQLGAMEKRAEQAEEQVTILMREREENAVKVHHTICRLASVHAKQLADLEARKMNVDAPAPATVIGKRTSESLDFSARHVGRRRKSGGQGRQEGDGRPQKRVRW
ncbi:hypothetical protein FB45DRAFT_859370 [Roridomyces roridus]|uniref:Uncharacterized protein n=1 Tax=Roridomyces roridus TaxID=1738132 RepID=A0AAD7CK50_9AGAR|nr:hypothetical protein FB45DRAFT_859370 [Roridomyces roridus]